MLDLRTTPFVVVDVETTGLNPATERVCEVGALRLVNGREEGRFESLVRPDHPVSPGARAQHGITDAMLRGAPPFAEIAAQLRQFLAGTILVAQNAEFDLAFLNAEFRRAGLTPLPNAAVDTIVLARRARPGLATYNLDNLARHFRLEFTERHRSIGDCEVTAEIFRQCVEILRPKSLDDLLRRGAARR